MYAELYLSANYEPRVVLFPRLSPRVVAIYFDSLLLGIKPEVLTSLRSPEVVLEMEIPFRHILPAAEMEFLAVKSGEIFSKTSLLILAKYDYPLRSPSKI